MNSALPLGTFASAMALVATAAITATATVPALAQTAPVRPLRIIVPYTAGSSSDIRGRIVAQAMAAQLGQPVIIDNRPGIAGADILAKAMPDGQTTGFLNATVLATATLLSATLPYDPDRDYTAVALISNSPEVLVTDAKLNFHSVAELIAHAKAHPGKLNFGSAGATSLTRLAMELFKVEAGVNLVHVPYKGIGLAINDTIGGRVQTLISDLSGVQPFIRTGALKALAVTSARRIPLLPDVPTVGEIIPGFEVPPSWTGLLGPAQLSPAVLARISGDAIRALNQPETRARFVDTGIPMLSQSVLLKGVNDDPQTLGALMRAFVECRIKPYYLHHGDLAPGTSHLRTTIAEGQALMRGLRGRYSGLCQPAYVLDIPGGHGKSPVGPNYLSANGEGRMQIEDFNGVLHCYPLPK